jgi:hypothetical protein
MTNSARLQGPDAPVPRPATIEVHVQGLRQLFNAMDPSPFRERDLDPTAEAFVVEWAREVSRNAPLQLLVRLGRGAGPPGETQMLQEAVHEFFLREAASTRRRLRELLRRGRISLLIGLAAVAAALVGSELLGAALSGWRLAELLRASLVIGGWVAMWRPLEVFLYDWWPIVADARLFDRLAAMPVRIVHHAAEAGPDAWRSDWPAVPPAGKPPGTDAATAN